LIERLKGDVLKETKGNAKDALLSLQEMALKADQTTTKRCIDSLEEIGKEVELDSELLQEIARILREVAIKSEVDILSRCITALEEIGKNAETYISIHYISAQLGFIGVNVARDPMKQTYSSEVISSLCDIGVENIKGDKLDEKERLWLTKGIIQQIGYVFKEMLQDKELKVITDNEINCMLSSLNSFAEATINFADATIKNRSLEEQSKQILALMRYVAFESEKISRVDHYAVLKDYKDHLYLLLDKEPLSEDLKNKIEKTYEEARNKIASLKK